MILITKTSDQTMYVSMYVCMYEYMYVYIRGTSTHLRREHGNKTRQTKNKKKGTITQSTCRKKIGEGHLIERVWFTASREPSDNLPRSQPCTQTHSIYHTPSSQGFSFLYRHNRRRELCTIIQCYACVSASDVISRDISPPWLAGYQYLVHFIW